MPALSTSPAQPAAQPKAPEHVAIIMDGNRRWAQNRGLKSIKGHEKGVETLEAVMKYCVKRGVKTLTVYAFSTENWKRTKEEVAYLLRLIVRFLRNKKDELFRNGISLRPIGEISDFPRFVQDTLRKTTEYLSSNKKQKLVLNIALSYGGRKEIVTAVQHMINDGMSAKDISEETIQKYLYTKSQKDPDLIIRTGGHVRLSNFLLWQSSYSELYFTNTLWPDFTEKEFDKALEDFYARKRNFGS